MDNYENGLFIFRRDLRIVDNSAFNYANKVCKNLYTIFIFTPEQVVRNSFKYGICLYSLVSKRTPSMSRR